MSEESALTETVRYFLDPADFVDELRDNHIDFWTGVPDTNLMDVLAYVDDTTDTDRHVLAANEGAAIGIAAGYHLATRHTPVVYMQNSGLGNAANPLLSLADPKVYSIPMLLLVGWRGEPGKKDEPQHLPMGRRTEKLLTDLGIAYDVLPDYAEGASKAISAAVKHMDTTNSPYCLLVKRRTFQSYHTGDDDAAAAAASAETEGLLREDALRVILNNAGPWGIVVATTGFTSREVHDLRRQARQDHRRDFMAVGAMGHSSAIALGIAKARPTRRVFCLDGDGSALMHMGTLGTVGTAGGLSNLVHIIINNGQHESVGGQPTHADRIDFCNVARSCGYADARVVSDADSLASALSELEAQEPRGPVMVQIDVKPGVRANLSPLRMSPGENKSMFMNYVNIPLRVGRKD